MASITSQRPKPRTRRNNAETRDIMTRNARRLRLYRGLLAQVPKSLLRFMATGPQYYGYMFAEEAIARTGILPAPVLKTFLKDLRYAGFFLPPEDPRSWFFTGQPDANT